MKNIIWNYANTAQKNKHFYGQYLPFNGKKLLLTDAGILFQTTFQAMGFITICVSLSRVWVQSSGLRESLNSKRVYYTAVLRSRDTHRSANDFF